MNRSSVLSAIAGMCGALGAVSGKLAFDSEIGDYTRISCFAVFIASNLAMWATYTRALTLSDSTTSPMIVNTACNFALTGILGNLIFGESHSYMWWFFLAVLITGLTMMLSPSSKDSKEE